MRPLTPHETACALAAVRGPESLREHCARILGHTPSYLEYLRWATTQWADWYEEHGVDSYADLGLTYAQAEAALIEEWVAPTDSAPPCTHCDRAAHVCSDAPCSRARAELRADAEVSDVR